MAATARCVRTLLKSSSNLNSSARLLNRCINGSNSARSLTSVSLRTSLKEVGLLNNARNNNLVSKTSFNLRPVGSLCNISTIPILNIEGNGGSNEGLEASSDDDAETWSQNGDEAYIGDDT